MIHTYGGAGVSHDFSCAFGGVISPLPGFQTNYAEHYDKILDQISWFSVADGIGKKLLKLVPAG